MCSRFFLCMPSRLSCFQNRFLAIFGLIIYIFSLLTRFITSCKNDIFNIQRQRLFSRQLHHVLETIEQLEYLFLRFVTMHLET